MTTAIILASVSGVYLLSYFIFALMILKRRRYKTEVSVVVSMVVFLANFLVKFIIQVLMAQDNQTFLVEHTKEMILIEFLMSNAVILNLYYFAYSMRSVKDTLESKSPEDLKQK